MAEPVLTVRELNRATLARQMLLERAGIPISEAIERLVGLHAQIPMSPYIGLWTRLRDFQREDLARLIESRAVVKATLMRATLHLFTADDYVRFRATLQPMLTQASAGISKRRSADFDLEFVLDAARRFIAEKPRTFATISQMLTELLPGHDIGPLRYAVRMRVPLVQTPISGRWSFPGNPEFTLAEPWIGRPIAPVQNLRDFIFRYLAAFGPASVSDMQAWSGLSGLKEQFEKERRRLKVYRDEQRRELFDLPDAPFPDADSPAPVRFLPELDNLLLAHRDRTRVIAEEYRSRVFLANLRVRGTFLVDGFVAGVWRTEAKTGAATLDIEPFTKLKNPQRNALLEEANALIRFVEPKAKSFDVRFAQLPSRAS